MIPQHKMSRIDKSKKHRKHISGFKELKKIEGMGSDSSWAQSFGGI